MYALILDGKVVAISEKPGQSLPDYHWMPCGPAVKVGYHYDPNKAFFPKSEPRTKVETTVFEKYSGWSNDRKHRQIHPSIREPWLSGLDC